MPKFFSNVNYILGYILATYFLGLERSQRKHSKRARTLGKIVKFLLLVSWRRLRSLYHVGSEVVLFYCGSFVAPTWFNRIDKFGAVFIGRFFRGQFCFHRAGSDKFSEFFFFQQKFGASSFFLQEQRGLGLVVRLSSVVGKFVWEGRYLVKVRIQCSLLFSCSVVN